jgi:hypothetical protein
LSISATRRSAASIAFLPRWGVLECADSPSKCSIDSQQARLEDGVALVCAHADELRGLADQGVAEPARAACLDQTSRAAQPDLLGERPDEPKRARELRGVQLGERGDLADQVDLGVGRAEAVEAVPVARRPERITAGGRPRGGLAGRHRVEVGHQQHAVPPARLRSQVGDHVPVSDAVDLDLVDSVHEADRSEQLPRSRGDLQIPIARDGGRRDEPLGPVE